MSWVEFEDSVMGRVVVELQPTAVEVFGARSSEPTRIHLRMLVVDLPGPNGQGHQQVRLGAAGGHSITLTVTDQWWPRLWPWVEQVRQAQVPFAHTGY